LTSETEITDLEVTVLADEDIGRLEIAMDDAGRMDELEASQDLIGEVLYVTILKGPRGKKTVQVGRKELCYNVDVLRWRYKHVVQGKKLL
jgi:hypothetical protein